MPASLIYQIAFIISIISVVAISILFVVRMLRSSYFDIKYLGPAVGYYDNLLKEGKRRGDGESKKAFSKEKEELKSMIEEIESKVEGREEALKLTKWWDMQGDAGLWGEDIKGLLLGNKLSSYNILRYNLYTVEKLKELEKEFRSGAGALKYLLEQGKRLYFRGDIETSKAFSNLFVEGERNKYKHLYMLPFVYEGEELGSVILISIRELREELNEFLQGFG